jgi:hypothetical protein
MTKQIYFVVAVDLETGEASFDNDTADIRFPDGLVWDGEEWRAETEDEFHEGYAKVRTILDN